jgi:hypothetical protein
VVVVQLVVPMPRSMLDCGRGLVKLDHHVINEYCAGLFSVVTV